MTLKTLKHFTNLNKKGVMTMAEKKKRTFEFSKIILAFVIFSYFVGLGFGMYVIIAMIKAATFIYIATALCGLFTYIATPVSVALGFYSNKAKAENVEKIKGNTVQNTIKIPLDKGGIS